MRAVIPSLHYADMLAVILPGWCQVLTPAALTVVTSPDDHETIAIAEQHGVAVIATDAWTRDGAVLNKAAALDEAFGFVPGFRRFPLYGEVCLALDADVYPFGRFPSHEAIAAHTIYGCARYRCHSAEELRAHLEGRTKRAVLDLIPPKVRGESYTTVPNTRDNALASASRCLGFFQLFRWRPGLAFGSSRTAGKYDLDFRDKFPHRSALWDFYVLHLGEQSRENWRGRVTARWQ